MTLYLNIPLNYRNTQITENYFWYEPKGIYFIT